MEAVGSGDESKENMATGFYCKCYSEIIQYENYTIHEHLEILQLIHRVGSKP